MESAVARVCGKEEHTSQQLTEPETAKSIKEWYWESSAAWEERVLEKGDTLRLGSHCEGQPC